VLASPPFFAVPTQPPTPLLRAAHAYGEASVPWKTFPWPIRPFHRQHPIRATFGEPRGLTDIGLAMRGANRALALRAADQIAAGGERILHTGVDIEAPDGTPVYAVRSGVAETGGIGYDRHVIVGGFGYWHLANAVPSGTRVVALHTVLGTVYPGQHHVHLTRFAGGVPVNPLVAGGFRPYRDTAAPLIGPLKAYAPTGRRVPLRRLSGPVVLAVRAADVQSLGGAHTGVYRLRWVLLPWRGRSRALIRPESVVRFNALPLPPIGNLLYTVGSGRHHFTTDFWYRLTDRSPSGDGFLHAERLAPRLYRLGVEAYDERGNGARRVFVIRVVRSSSPSSVTSSRASPAASARAAGSTPVSTPRASRARTTVSVATLPGAPGA
jgi:hypothetical protein